MFEFGGGAPVGAIAPSARLCRRPVPERVSPLFVSPRDTFDENLSTSPPIHVLSKMSDTTERIELYPKFPPSIFFDCTHDNESIIQVTLFDYFFSACFNLFHLMYVYPDSIFREDVMLIYLPWNRWF